MAELCQVPGWLPALVVLLGVGLLLLGVGLGALLAGWHPLPPPAAAEETVETSRVRRGRHRVGARRRPVSRPRVPLADRDTVQVQVVDPPKRGGGRG